MADSKKDDDLYSGGEDEKGNTGSPDMGGDEPSAPPAPDKPDTTVHTKPPSRSS